MQNQEKGALKNDHKKFQNSTEISSSKIKSLKKEDNKNSKIVDYFKNNPNSLNSPNLSSRKRNRSEEREMEGKDSSNIQDLNSYEKLRKSGEDIYIGVEEINVDDDKAAASKKEPRVKKNRNSCSICREGGNILLCDNCPKSFHTECLKMKEADIPEGEWYCPECM